MPSPVNTLPSPSHWSAPASVDLALCSISDNLADTRLLFTSRSHNLVLGKLCGFWIYGMAIETLFQMKQVENGQK